MIFSNILNINFYFVFPSCKCVEFAYYDKILKLLRNFFMNIFNLSFFCREIVKFYQFFTVVLLQIHFRSGAARK
jgi:hypothetical protein